MYYVNAEGEFLFYHSFFNETYFVTGVSELYQELQFIWKLN